MPECLFCRIVSGGVPASRVLESPRTLSFRDISPQAPTHVLVIPKDHYPDLASLAAADGGGLLTELVTQAREVAEAEGISGRGTGLFQHGGRRWPGCAARACARPGRPRAGLAAGLTRSLAPG